LIAHIPATISINPDQRALRAPPCFSMGHAIAAKLVWIWISFLITVLTFWRVRSLWIRCRPERNKRIKYTTRLAKRLKDRRRMQMKSRQEKIARRRPSH